MTKRAAKCIGCRNDFYNGKNDLGVKVCWSLKTARIVSKVEVPIHQRPPYSQPARKVYSCYHRQGYAYLEPAEVQRTNAYCAQYDAQQKAKP